jgi:hypothetical protein
MHDLCYTPVDPMRCHDRQCPLPGIPVAGGLGKMPGMYFDAESSRVAHLSAKLHHEVNRALSLDEPARRRLVEVSRPAASSASSTAAASLHVWIRVLASTLSLTTAGFHILQHAEIACQMRADPATGRATSSRALASCACETSR